METVPSNPLPASDPDSGAPITLDRQSTVYDAFISYSNALDGKFAPALQTAIERYAKPWYRSRALRLFRDTTNLSVTPDLWHSIETALVRSRYLILLASPAAAQSKWVQREVSFWLTHAGSARIIIVLTSGYIVWSEQDQDFAWNKTDALPNLLSKTFEHEPLYVDLRWAREPRQDLTLNNPLFSQPILAIAAKIQERQVDELGGEAVRQMRTTRRLVVATICAISTLAVVAGIFAILASWQADLATNRAEDAQRRDSLRLAFSSRDETRSGNATDGLHLALSALPVNFTVDSGWQFWRKSGPDRPLVAEAAGALVEALTAQRESVVFKSEATENDDGVIALGLLRDPNRAYAFSKKGRLRIWDTSSGVELSHFDSPSISPKFFSLNPDADEALVADDSGEIYFWNWKTGGRAFKLPIRSPGLNGVQDILVVTWSKQRKRLVIQPPEKGPTLYELPSGRVVADLSSLPAPISESNFYERSDKTILRVVAGPTVHLIDAANGMKLQHDDIYDTLDRLSESRDHNTIVTVGFLGAGGAVVHKRQDAASPFDTERSVELSPRDWVQLSPDGALLAKISANGEIEISKSGSRVYLKSLFAGEPVDQIAFSENGSQLIALLNTGMISVFNAGPTGWFDGFSMSPAPGYASLLSPDGKSVTMGALAVNSRRSLGGFFVSFNLQTGEQIERVEVDGWVRKIKRDPDSLQTAVITTNGRLIIFNQRPLSSSRTLDAPNSDDFEAVEYSSKKHSWVAATVNGKILYLNPEDGQELDRIDLQSKSLEDFGASADGQYMAAVVNESQVISWQAGRYQETRIVRTLPEKIHCLAISSKGQIATGSETGKIFISAMSSLTVNSTYSADGHIINALTFEEGSDRLAAVTAGGNLFVWDRANHDNDLVIRQGLAQLYSVHFTLDGENLLTTGHDGRARIWHVGHSVRALVDAAKQKHLRCINGDRSRLYGLADAQADNQSGCVISSSRGLPSP